MNLKSIYLAHVLYQWLACNDNNWGVMGSTRTGVADQILDIYDSRSIAFVVETSHLSPLISWL